MKDIIKLNLTKTDARKCGLYYSECGCLVATALKRRFPGQHVKVSGFDLELGLDRYSISDPWAIARAYSDGCREPLPLTRFKPFSIELTRKP